MPSFGMLSLHTLSSSNNMASKAWSTLSSSSMSKTQGFSHSKARISGPALKKSWLCSSVRNDAQSMSPDLALKFDAKSLQRLRRICQWPFLR